MQRSLAIANCPLLFLWFSNDRRKWLVRANAAATAIAIVVVQTQNFSPLWVVASALVSGAVTIAAAARSGTRESSSAATLPG